MENEYNNFVEDDEDLTLKNYLVDITNIKNRDAILDVFDNNQFKQLLHDKKFVVNLRPEIDINEKRNIVKKKKNLTPYIINSFIIYTSFLSKADIKLKKDNKSWQMMGVDTKTKIPLDKDGSEFRKLIEELEMFHKKLIIDDVDDTPSNNNLKTTILRRKVIAYAQTLLIACYKGEDAVKPHITMFLDDKNANENDIVANRCLEACNQLYKYINNFKLKTEQFKLFLNRHQLYKQNDEESESGEKRKIAQDLKGISNKKRIITEDMVSDEGVEVSNL